MTQEERHCILARVNLDRGDASAEPFTFKRWLASGADWKVSCVVVVLTALQADDGVDLGLCNHFWVHYDGHLCSGLL